MPDWLLRTQTLIGESAVKHLQQSCVAILGLGGVGGSCAEAICRAGVGKIILLDQDCFDITNLNRQLFATLDTIGVPKVEVAKKRLLSINPDCEIITLQEFFLPSNGDDLFALHPHMIIDAIDTVTSKLYLMERCYHEGIPLISSMGTGNRLDPSQFKIGDIADTAGCGCNLAKVIRRELKKRGIPKQTVLYSTEFPQKIDQGFVGDNAHGRHAPASISFTPPAAGYLLASYAVRTLIGKL
ncbi:MAG: tRNA threonylcarbamoyladenosine dehydratase [Massiliimalia sp.]|jgi:tRNA A37 threonylcarbamoyladenosine dehydratase